MLQKIFRGQLVYFILAVLVVSLYLRVAPPGPPTAPTVAPAHSDTLELWPKEMERLQLDELLSQQPLLAFALIGLGVFVAGMGLGGLGLLGWTVIRGRLRRAWHLGTGSLPRWTWGELARVTLLIIIVASLMPFVRLTVLFYQPSWAADLHVWMTVGMLLLDAFVIVAVLAFAAGKGLPVRQVLGPGTGGFADAIAVGLRAYMTVFPWLVALLFLIVKVSHALHLQPPLQPLHELLFRPQHPFVLWLTTALACVVGPVAEELFFRGVVYTTLRHRMSRWLAMAASGAVFSLVHTNVVGFVPILALGWLLAYLYERTGSLVAPMAVHVLHNTFLMSAALVFRHFMDVSG